MVHFDPNAAPDDDAGIFGLPHTEKDSSLVLLPVPWEATTSYGGGTSKGPSAILAASGQIDLYDSDVEKPYEPGIFMRPESAAVLGWNRQAKPAARKVIESVGKKKKDLAVEKALRTVNGLGDKLNDWVHRETKSILGEGKIPGIVGGDHSVPLGAYKAAAEMSGEFGLLHFDAHADMRNAYEGFVWSHASIMRNAMSNVSQISKIVQVGIRDFCEEEKDYIEELGPRAKVFLDRELNERRFRGEPWIKTAQDIVAELPTRVWITFDIDGLDPKLCPNTGTPVPGGLSFAEAAYIISIVAISGRTIIGFDLVEVAPGKSGEWDANVGMRLLYKLAAWTFVSRGLSQPHKR